MKDRSHDEAMAEYLLTHPIYAAELLASVRLEGDVAELAILLKQLGKPFEYPQKLNQEPKS